MPGGVCSNCIESGSECTHLTGKRAQTRSGNSSQDALRLGPLLLAGENRAGRPPLPDLEEYASTSSKAYHISTWAAPQGDRGDVQKTLTEFSEYIKVLEARLSSQDTSESEPGTPESEDDTDTVLPDHLRFLTMSDSRERVYGKSSGLVLRKTASTVIANAGLSSRPSARRPEMWQVYPWQIMQESRPDFLIFPDNDLMETLIDLYFTHWNLFRPLLHRPSFEKSLRQGLHYRDYYFGATVLVVCALGSAYSNDRRVFLDDTTELSCGWPFFRQVQPLQGTSLASPPSLHELQYYCLSVIFMHGTSLKASWPVLGIALRLAQDVGLHRKLAVDPKSTSAIDNESWKRVLWCLASMDPLTSSFFGRPPGLNSDDFDQEYPLECDDEYWLLSNPEKAFKQPAGRPSTISYFISYLKLVGILEMAQRILYAANSTISKKQAVSQLDEALAKWMDSVPAHLRWDPHRKDMVFFRQSGCLYTTYYYVRMQVHQSALLYSSSNLVGSVEAARRCTDVLEHLSRKAPLAFPLIHVILFSSTTMLLINHWKNPSQSKKDLDDIGRCQKLIQSQENRWQIAGKLSDTITGLLTYVEQSFPYVQVSSRKRPKEESWVSTSQLSNQPSTSQLS
ncbi:fungal-specific transcription factor domain-containing protein [Mycena floridula]|nr:fungal-specific transcription factor domain-containing protein [Mycena floridula]